MEAINFTPTANEHWTLLKNEAFGRLRKLKNKYDPDNRLDFSYHILPSGMEV